MTARWTLPGVWTFLCLAHYAATGLIVRAPEGSSAYLPCPHLHDVTAVTWRRRSLRHDVFETHDAAIPDVNVTSRRMYVFPRNMTLWIPHVEVEDDDIYLCQTSDGEERHVTLTVTVAPELHVLGIPLAARVGDVVRLTCAVPRARPAPQRLYWVYDDDTGDVLAESPLVTSLGHDVVSVTSSLVHVVTDGNMARPLVCLLVTGANQLITRRVRLSACGAWLAVAHAARLGGRRAPDDVQTPAECGRRCEGDPRCDTWDFDTCTWHCYINDISAAGHPLHAAYGVFQHRRTDCEALPPTKLPAQLSSIDQFDSSLRLTLAAASVKEGETLVASCISAERYPAPDGLYFQFTDQAAELLTSLQRSPGEHGYVLTASLTLTVDRAYDRRQMRCVERYGDSLKYSAALTVHVCYPGYRAAESGRLAAGHRLAEGVALPETCMKLCDTDTDCEAFEFDYCKQRCYKHGSVISLDSTASLYDTLLYHKSSCVFDPALLEATADAVHNIDASFFSQYDLKIIIGGGVVLLVLVILIIVAAIAIRHCCKNRSSRVKYERGKKVAGSADIYLGDSNTGTLPRSSRRKPKKSLPEPAVRPRLVGGFMPRDNAATLPHRGPQYATLPRHNSHGKTNGYTSPNDTLETTVPSQLNSPARTSTRVHSRHGSSNTLASLEDL